MTNVSVFDMTTMQHLWSTPEMREIFSEKNRLQKWLDFEVALARTQAELGIIPEAAAEEIAAAAHIDRVDLEAVAEEVRRIKHTLVPLLKGLQANLGKEAAEFLHYGATTQDVVDTGLILQLQQAHRVFCRDLGAVGRELMRLAAEHRDTVMVGRTHGVQALPITFGHKCAIWLDELSRHAERMEQAAPRVFVVMLVGAVGTQASYGPKAREIEAGTARRLGLGATDISWAPSRDRIAEYITLLAMIAGTLGKIGNELFNLQRNEFAEVEEGFSEGKLGSSTMPHKRNPVAAENVAMLSRSVRYSAAMMMEAMVQEHERDGIAWKSEWKAVPEACLVTGAILMQAGALLKGLRVDRKAMDRNVALMKGYLLSERVMLELGERVGKNTAHEWLYEASMKGIESGASFADALSSHPHIADAFSAEEIDRLTEPGEYLGDVGASVDRVLARERGAKWLSEQ
ncbi:adenylosuccinate lyase [Consotaella salsifontis]|uniref:3-carboxy-cis,cis-muconate cycloisomerase n=1 Tax=Consotaella salsifontis TaxID=1365950 RepID=A0A1T4TC83_9HYPH|nr:adenylosuccinate lyase [Consotaella salsifontis]SKA38033.1 3-carboxy-cis,cis-muconate cycloisomerase [Consotaella salsifontis]